MRIGEGRLPLLAGGTGHEIRWCTSTFWRVSDVPTRRWKTAFSGSHFKGPLDDHLTTQGLVKICRDGLIAPVREKPHGRAFTTRCVTFSLSLTPSMSFRRRGWRGGRRFRPRCLLERASWMRGFHSLARDAAYILFRAPCSNFCRRCVATCLCFLRAGVSRTHQGLKRKDVVGQVAAGRTWTLEDADDASQCDWCHRPACRSPGARGMSRR